MRRLAAVLTALSMVVALAVPPPAAAATAPERVFRTNLPSDLSTLDPTTFVGPIGAAVFHQVYEGLTAITPDGRLEPALAIRWESLDGGRGWRFTLREGVRFHSGRPFTAHDVRWTFEALLKPNHRGGVGALLLKNVVGAQDVAEGRASALSGVHIVDDHTLDVRFNEPEVLFPHFPFLIVDRGMADAHGATWFLTGSGGTGPYRVAAWRRGVSLTLRAHEAYWGGPPAVPRIEMQVLPSFETALMLYDAGDLDYLTVADGALAAVAGNERRHAELVRSPRAQVRHLGLNAERYPPFADARVRRAVSLAIDRDAVVRALFGGEAIVVPGTTTPGVAGYGGDALPPLRYDPDAARRLLAEAGFPEGRGLPSVELAGLDSARDELAYYADQLRRSLGLPVTVRTYERGAFLAAINAGALAFFLGGWTADYPDAMNYLHSMWHSASPYNRARWRNAAFDRLIDRARRMADDAERYALYHEAERLLMEASATVPLPTLLRVALRKPNVHNVGPTPFGYSSFAAITIR